MYVGNSGAANTLNLLTGGSVIASNAFVGFNAGADGNRINATGGSLYVTNAPGVGALDIRRGTLQLEGGLVSADRLFATNGAASAINFSGGRLVAQNIEVNNGSALTVGDGAGETATLQLPHNSHTKVANGLTITSDGVLEIGSSPGRANIEGNLTLQSGATMKLDWASLGSSDILNVTGNVFLAGSLEVNLDFSPQVGDRFTNLFVFGASHSISGNFDNGNNVTVTGGGALPAGGSLVFKMDSTMGYLEVIPEPSALLLVGVGLVLAVMPRRRS